MLARAGLGLALALMDIRFKRVFRQMWVRTQLKIGWLDLLAGAWNCFKSNDRERLRRSVENFFSDRDDTIATYSVRSGFDLLMQALDLKPGDEVIFSALNVKGMVRVVRDA